ncbi:MAG: ATP-binding protein [Halofilum sp. (in: g-proteobacteria)]|nr:ATP-binding protein [Halofilum sp. (in: g-proteobacteria)]
MSQMAQSGKAVSASVRHSQEFQSSIVRLAMWVVMVLILGIGGSTGYYRIDWPLYGVLFGIHFVWFVGLLAWAIIAPELKPWRTYIAVVSDLSATTLVIYLSGGILEPFVLIYVLSFLSQGTRFGATNLAIASIGSAVCYSALAVVMGGWTQYPVEVAFIVLALLLLPLYQNRLLRNLTAARRNAEIAKRARGDFLATMTHELRTPLSGVIGMARLLDRTDLDDEQRKYVRSICSSADTLQALIGDILDLSKVDAGALQLDRERFDLREAILEVVHTLGRGALEKGVEPVCCIDTALPEFVTGDRVRFQQILYNLVGNAVKFTDRGRVSVEAHLLAADARIDRPHLEVMITDTGVGIPADRLDCIFDSFWQADTSTSREYGGTGLGTTIAARLVDAMDGYIDVESEAGRGSSFRVHLPLLSGEPQADAPPPPVRRLVGRTALLFETEPKSLRALEEVCRSVGMHTMPCGGESEIEELSSEYTVDVIVVADSAAGIDLAAVERKLRERCRTEAPALHMHYRGRIMDPGTETARTHKPFHPVTLCRRMGDCIASAESGTGECMDANVSAAGGQRSVGAYRILVVEDDATNADMICILLRSWGHQVVLACEGSEALDALDGDTFDLLLVDIRMPGMDGTELTREIRRREGNARRVPIVALTANVAEDTRTDSLAAGMDHFLTKPVDPEKLDGLLQGLQRGAPAMAT